MESDFVIRPLRTMAECHAAVDLQRDVWGREYTDIVPATLLHVLDHVGGLAAGAFDSSGTMLGFVFGIHGVRDGELVHWSHMLGVRESERNVGVGRSLKEYQRETVRDLGVKRVFWSFDPLMAKNAYFNLNRLGAEVVEYVPDMYGTTTSKLHLGLATDRFIVSVPTEPRHDSPAPVTTDGLPVLTAFPQLSDPTVSVGDRSPDAALIEIPGDILDVLANSPMSARTWRLAVRDHFRWALGNGYSVLGVHRDAARKRFFYVVARTRGHAYSQRNDSVGSTRVARSAGM